MLDSGLKYDFKRHHLDERPFKHDEIASISLCAAITHQHREYQSFICTTGVEVCSLKLIEGHPNISLTPIY